MRSRQPNWQAKLTPGLPLSWATNNGPNAVAAVQAVLASGPLRDGQQPFPFVVPNRIGSHSGPGR